MTNKINSALHPFEVGKSSTGFFVWGLRPGTFTGVKRQLTLCDLIRQVTLLISEMSFSSVTITLSHF